MDSRIVRSHSSLRAALTSALRGLVPTMGALHDGHAALIRRSAVENDVTVVSIFVNPTQFTDNRDLAGYPRDLESDAGFAFAAGADLIYAPAVNEVYPTGFSATGDAGPLGVPWEGEFRPGHFRGVATVVAILLNSVRPARAYFGEKDYQQLCVIRRMTRDLRLPGEIVGCPTIRDVDGLALSSRNARLDVEQRRAATAIPEALNRMRSLANEGVESVAELVSAGRLVLCRSPLLEVEYLAVVDAETLEAITLLAPGATALIAVRAGQTRLIDNMELAPKLEVMVRQ